MPLMHYKFPKLFLILSLILIGKSSLIAQSQISSEDCSACHEVKITSPVHKKVNCLDCHLIKELPHRKPIAKVNCLLCHKNMEEMQQIDPHERAQKRGIPAPSCSACHGSHQIYPVSSPKSPLHPKNIENFCNTCHMNVSHKERYHIPNISNDTCLECHNLTYRAAPPFDVAQFNKSVHNKHFCIDCHRDIEKIPHPKNLEEPACRLCHKNESDKHKRSIHGKAISSGIQEAANCWDCHGNHYILPSYEPDSSVNKLKISSTCGKCHAKVALAKKCNIPIKNPFALYQKSVHLKALVNGQNAATCVNCHGVHNIAPATDLSAPINKGNLPKTCGSCHSKAYKDYTMSQHWRAFLLGINESPVCNDCHLEHSIFPSENPSSPVYPKNIPKTCSSCHEAQKITERYGIRSMRLSTYNSSYHGLALKAGNMLAANCASCHEHHKILPSSDPRSSIYPKNLPKTCGQCHPGVSISIPIGKVHERSDNLNIIFDIVQYFYIYLIIIVIGAMVIYCFVDFQRKVKYPDSYKWEKSKGYYIKFNYIDRLFHTIHLICFIVLVYTGFAHHYPEAIWAKPIINLYGDSVRAIAHRTSGAIIIIIFLLQLLIFAFTKYGRKQFQALLPKFSDLKDAKNLFLFNLGLLNKKPLFAKFSFIEKFEYWALVWGNIIMGITGFALWFENLFLSIFPKWILDLFILIHFYEAILASLSILIWHLYWTIFDPEVYPFSLTIWTGKAPIYEVADTENNLSTE